MRALVILSALALSACHTTPQRYVDDGTVQPFGGNNTYAIDLRANFNYFRGTPVDYLSVSNDKCTSMGYYMHPVHKDGSMFVFRCTSQPSDTNWRTDRGVATVEVK